MPTALRGSRYLIAGLAVIAWTLLFTPPASAIKINLERPGEREFVRDQAQMLDAATVAQIKTIADKLLTDKATPILVVTIESMASCGAPGLRIETFATLLFDQWGIGVADLNGEPWNTGILLLISKGDRRARIELEKIDFANKSWMNRSPTTSSNSNSPRASWPVSSPWSAWLASCPYPLNPSRLRTTCAFMGALL